MTPAAELHRLEQLLLKWPMSVRIRRMVTKLRRQVAEQETRRHQQEEAKAQALRGEIRRRLMAADVNTLAQVAQQLRSAS